MSENKVLTIFAHFATRDAAERAVERLVQEHKIDRADIFIQASESDNSAGSRVSGADASPRTEEGSAFGAALHGPIEVSADVSRTELSKVEEAFREAGATHVGSQ